MAAPMNTRPEAVAIGPPKLGVPTPRTKNCEPGARSPVAPSGVRQSTWPVVMSTALSRPQGGGLQGRPSGERSSSRRMP